MTKVVTPRSEHVTTSHLTHHKPKEENTKKKFLGRVLGPDGILTTSHIITSHHIRQHKPKDAISPHHTSHIIASHQTADITSHHITHHKPKEENTKKKFLGRVLGPDGILTTSHIITSHHIRHHKPKDAISPHHTSHIIASHQTSDITSHHITHDKPKEENTNKKFLGRVLGPDGILTTSHIITSHHIRHHKPKGRKSTSFIVKTLFKSIPEERKVRELPRKMNIEEVEEPKKYENYHAKPVSDPFKSIAEHRKVRELPRNMNIEEVEEPETTKIHIQTPWTPAAATRKVRKFTDKTNMQARNHENSDEFRPPPRSSHQAFSLTVRTPSVKHTVWGILR